MDNIFRSIFSQVAITQNSKENVSFDWNRGREIHYPVRERLKDGQSESSHNDHSRLPKNGKSYV